jgi:hypothetical protein
VGGVHAAHRHRRAADGHVSGDAHRSHRCRLGRAGLGHDLGCSARTPHPRPGLDRADQIQPPGRCRARLQSGQTRSQELPPATGRRRGHAAVRGLPFPLRGHHDGQAVAGRDGGRPGHPRRPAGLAELRRPRLGPRGGHGLARGRVGPLEVSVQTETHRQRAPRALRVAREHQARPRRSRRAAGGRSPRAPAGLECRTPGGLRPQAPGRQPQVVFGDRGQTGGKRASEDPATLHARPLVGTAQSRLHPPSGSTQLRRS